MAWSKERLSFDFHNNFASLIFVNCFWQYVVQLSWWNLGFVFNLAQLLESKQRRAEHRSRYHETFCVLKNYYPDITHKTRGPRFTTFQDSFVTYGLATTDSSSRKHRGFGGNLISIRPCKHQMSHIAIHQEKKNICMGTFNCSSLSKRRHDRSLNMHIV